ncbi:MAG: hypothetical protein FJW39_10795 [Acidobacteria bacterium]|nr:hypothetical protein [Acidobacteriota bacterium]
MALSALPLDRAQFDALLARLDSDRDNAAVRYEELRERLVRYFEWEGTADDDQLADECLTRLARRIAAGERVDSPAGYVAGIARLLARERRRAEAKRASTLPDIAAPQPKDEPRDWAKAEQHLDQCLAELPAESRSLVLRYYEGDAGERIRNRARLAREMGISVNSLRNRALRVRARLERCLVDCGGRDESGLGVTNRERTID